MSATYWLTLVNGDVMRLRIESTDGSQVNDYRIRDASVEVRWLNPSGQPIPGALGSWRALDDRDIALHHALGTVLSEWLRVRMGGVKRKQRSKA